MAKVTFDGPNKLIIVNSNETSINVKVDLYSDWKEWVQIGDNSKYLMAMSAAGGDPVGEGLSLGSTFFLENGWKVRPYEGTHTLRITGNLYTRDGTSPVVPTLGDYNVVVEMKTSNIVDFIDTGTIINNTVNTLLNEPITGYVVSGTVGKLLQETLEAAELAMLM